MSVKTDYSKVADYDHMQNIRDTTTCKICGWPYAFPELSVGEAYKKCMEIHKLQDCDIAQKPEMPDVTMSASLRQRDDIHAVSGEASRAASSGSLDTSAISEQRKGDK